MGKGESVAQVGDREIFIRYQGDVESVGLADPFLMASLGAAQAKGEAEVIEVSDELRVSASLLQALPEYQRLCRVWWPEVGGVTIRAQINTVQFPRTGKSACFFSGGVDGFYSAIRNVGRLTHLVLCRGLDIPFEETYRWEKTIETAQQFANDHSLELVLVETNLKAELLTAVPDNHGSILIATAIDLGFDELLVPASDSPRIIMAWGSHPLTDPLFSTDVTTVVHDGVAPRIEKIRYLVESGVDLNGLRVCNRFAEYNCGTCEKCLRTSVALEIFGVEVSSLPRFNADHLDRVRLWQKVMTTSWRDNLDEARRAGRPDIAAPIERLLGRWERKEWLLKGDELFLGGRAYRMLRRLRQG